MATIDASIPLGVRPAQIESPVNQLAKVLQVQNYQQQGEMNRLTMDEKRRSIEQDAAYNRLYQSAVKPDGTIDRSKLYTGAAQGGFGSKIPALQEGFAKSDKAKTDAEKAQLESALKKFEVVGQIMSGVRDQASWDMARQQTAQMFGPEAAARLPEQYAPAFVEQNRIRAMSVKDQMEQKHKELTFQETKDNNLRVDARTVRGQDLLATTSTENNKRSVGAQYAIAGAGREQAAATRDAARIASDAKQRTDVELKLQDDYRTESKGWAETSTAMKKVMTAIETADKNPGSALAAGTGFMKLLDPNSVVRETELGMALNASGWFDRATNIANTLQNGRIMTAEQKKNLRSAANDLFAEAKKAQLEVDAAYKNRAKGYGVDAGRIIVDRGQNAPNAGQAQTVNPQVDELLKKYGGR